MDTDLTGKLLIALPGIGDARFARSVILVCAHSPEFAMGIVLNKPMAHLRLPQLFEQLDVPIEADVPDTFVLDGGPVSSDRGFVLHTDDVYNEGASLPVDGDICMTATRDILHAMGSAHRPGAVCWRLAIPAGAQANWKRNWPKMPGWSATWIRNSFSPAHMNANGVTHWAVSVSTVQDYRLIREMPDQ
jgi:putative AlgH/UPF0301 family transcriptional regulator